MTILVPGVHKPRLPSNLLQDGYRSYRKAEKGALAFAILNITLTCIAMISSLVGTIFWFATFIIKDLTTDREPSDNDFLHYFFTYVLFGGIVVLLVFSSIAFIFSVFLIHGICKKKPQHVKAYFVYGVLVTGVSVMSAIAYLIITSGTDPLTVAIVLLVCAVYSLFLAMIRATYKSYEQRAMFQYQDNLLVVASEVPKRI
ncbi:uncharacterized protein LOC126373373 [Pectinophora gossypiella]|uniref:uncharacterized protein LOC126373373 n=1 Tax=Pectinophora gossypiella TaxID=13191 RepID=UPI00214EF1AC|nr:uncharacterized protein LOC126373373 [Pectinophora gossypiella]